MIIIRNFKSEDSPISIKLFGKVSEPKINKQGYTMNRTIGNRLKQRWINIFKKTQVEIMAIDEENMLRLEEAFYSNTMLEIIDNDTNVTAYGYIIGNVLSLDYFFDKDNVKYWRGGLEIEE